MVYLKNKLYKASVESTIGHKSTDVMTTALNGTFYEYSKNGKISSKIEEDITFSVQQLFFKEPIGIECIYSEEQGKFHAIRKIGTHSYEKISSSGHKSRYYYENEVPVKIEIDSGVNAFTMLFER